MTRFTQILSSALLGGVFAMSTAAAFAADKVGVVGALNGAVEAKSEAGDMRTLAAGSEIFLNDEITTGPKGSAQLMFLDKSALTVSPNSAVIIDTFVYNPANGDGQMALNSAKGALRFIGGALSKKKPVKIKTPVSTIGIRGAIADAHIAPDTGATEAIFLFGKEMSVENMNGDVQVTTEFGTGLSLDTPMAMPAAMPPAAVQQRMDNSPVVAAKTVAPQNTTPSPAKQRINTMKSSGNAARTPANGSSDDGNTGPAPAPQSNNTNGDSGGNSTGGEKTTASSAGNEPAPARQNEGPVPANAPIAGDAPASPDSGPTPVGMMAQKAPEAGMTGTLPADTPFAMMEGAAPQMENTSMQQQQDAIRTETEAFIDTAGDENEGSSRSRSAGGFGMADLLEQRAGEGELNTDNSGFCQRNPAACQRINDVADNRNETEDPTPGGRDTASDLPPLDPTETEVADDTTDASSAGSSSGGSTSGGSTGGGSTGGGTTTAYNFFGELSEFDGTTQNFNALRMKENAAGTHHIGKFSMHGNTPSSSDPDVELVKPLANGTFESFTAAPDAIGIADGVDLRGYVYSTDSGSLYYYDTTANGNTEWAKFLFGNALLDDSDGDFNFANATEANTDYTVGLTASQANAAVLNGGGAGNSTDVMFYEFLPELSGDRSDFGRFDVGRVASDTAALGFNIYEGGLAAEALNTRGLAIDWGTGQFLQNSIKWNNGTAFGSHGRIDLAPTLAVTGGRVDPGQNVISHNVMFDYDGNTSFVGYDNFYVDATRVFADDTTSIIDGFVIEADTNNDSNYDNAQGAVADNTPAEFQSIGATNQLDGFAAGFMRTTDENNNPLAPRAFWNQKPNISGQDAYVKVIRDPANRTVGGHFRLGEVGVAGISDGIEGEFGDFTASGPGGDNVLLGESFYAAEQHNLIVDNEALGVGEVTDISGSLIATGDMNTDVSTANNYEFMHWGVWAATALRDHDADGGTSDHVDEIFIPYVVGNLASDLPTGSTNVTYSGEALGQFIVNSGNIEQALGTMTADVDLGMREIDNLNINFTDVGGIGALDLNGNVLPGEIAASTVFDNIDFVTGSWGAQGASGTFNGAFFGDGTEIGGNFEVNSSGTDTLEGLGIYIGECQAGC